MKSIKLLFLAVLATAFMTACNSNGGVKDAAEQAISADGNVTPNPADAQDAATAAAQNQIPEGPTTVMTFSETEFDFGTIDEGEMVSHTYKFTNTGNEPLIISNAKGSCGCTVPKWPREPVAPGQSADITVEFNSQGKKGQRTQKVTITANTVPPQTFLTLKGNVNPGAEEPAAAN